MWTYIFLDKRCENKSKRPLPRFLERRSPKANDTYAAIDEGDEGNDPGSTQKTYTTVDQKSFRNAGNPLLARARLAWSHDVGSSWSVRELLATVFLRPIAAFCCRGFSSCPVCRPTFLVCFQACRRQKSWAFGEPTFRRLRLPSLLCQTLFGHDRQDGPAGLFVFVGRVPASGITKDPAGPSWRW